MNTLALFLYISISFLMAMFCRPLQTKSHLPFPIFLILTGIVIAFSYRFLGFDTGVQNYNLSLISQYLFIPVILFSTAYHLSPKMILKNGLIHFLFAIPLTLITIFIVAVILYFSMSILSWNAALLTAAILAAAGSHAIADYLHYLKVSPRLIHILQVESLFTAILALTFYNFFLSLDISNSTLSIWLFNFFMDIIGGIFIGVVMSYIIILGLKLLKESKSEAILIFAGIYSAYLLAELWSVSGGFAVLTAGLMLGRLSKDKIHGDQHFIGKLFDSMYLFVISAIFLLVGSYLSWNLFTLHWSAILTGIIAVLLARVFCVYAGLGFYNFFSPAKAYSFRDQTLLVWCGIRAALPIALALALPSNFEYSETIQSIVFGVVLFGLIIQAPTVRLIFSLRNHL